MSCLKLTPRFLAVLLEDKVMSPKERMLSDLVLKMFRPKNNYFSSVRV